MPRSASPGRCPRRPLAGDRSPVTELAAVLPSVAAALGVPLDAADRASGRIELPDQIKIPGLIETLQLIELPEATSAVVLLVDGLGDKLLDRRGGHAPFLRHLRAGAAAVTSTVRSGFPSTTATSMGSFGTGALPGTHGLVGLDVLDPGRDVLFSELAWDPLVDPRTWQPNPTVFEQVARAGVEVVRIGPGYFDGSGLTEAALRGGRFVAASTLQARVDATVEAIRGRQRLAGRSARCLVYLYWGEVDKSGHVHGCESWEWGEELAQVDAAVSQLVARLGPQTLVVVTADHGMVDIPFTDRLDVAAEPDLARGVRHVGGEPRALHLYCEPGAAPDVLAAWRERLDGRMDVRSRDDVVRSGWFGRVSPRVLPRIGDVVASARDSVAVVDSRTARPELLRLIGLHGARTDEEQLIPLLVTSGGAR